MTAIQYKKVIERLEKIADNTQKTVTIQAVGKLIEEYTEKLIYAEYEEEYFRVKNLLND